MESLSARELNQRLVEMVRRERCLVVQFVIELAGLARRELHRELGYTSLFYYCVRQLGLSKSSAFRRSEAAQLIARFPAIAHLLRDGRLSIRSLVELRGILTEENHGEVLARAAGKSQEEAQILALESANDRYVPAAVKRTVWERDHGQCAWPMGHGKICGSTQQLEFDHAVEVALGGRPAADNIQLLCKAHNLMRAERNLGRQLMA